MAEKTGTNKNHMKGIVCILGAAFFFSLMSVFVKASGELPTMQKVFFRNLVAVVVAFATLVRTPERFAFRRDCVPDVLMRAMFGTAAVICNFWATDHMLLADANMLNKLSPFFAIIMSVFLLREIPTRREWLLVVMAFIGALFVIKPSAGVASFPAVIGALGGFGAGTAYTFVRRATRKGERGPVIVLVFSLVSCLTALPFTIAGYVPMTTTQLLMLMGAGASAACGQFFVTAAYRYSPAREISIYDYSQILWASFFGFIIFHTVPDVFSLVGYVIIISAAVIRWQLSRRG